LYTILSLSQKYIALVILPLSNVSPYVFLAHNTIIISPQNCHGEKTLRSAAIYKLAKLSDAMIWRTLLPQITCQNPNACHTKEYGK